jgi:hypothetical protein
LVNAALEQLVRWHMIWDGERGYRVAPPDEVAASEPAGQAAFLSSSAEADAHGTPAFTARPISTRRVLRSAELCRSWAGRL